MILFNNPSGGGKVNPTRDALTKMKCPLQGLMVQTEYGYIPWFEPALGWVSPASRLSAYNAKKARGDTHVGLTLSGQYHEFGEIYYNIPGQDYSQRLDELGGLILEASNHGFLTNLTLAGDGMSNADRTYNDPVGWTYGFQWLMENIERIRKGLDSVSQYIVWNPGYDGIVPAWQPWNCVDQWLLKFRSIDSKGVLALECGAGYWAWSGESDDYNATRPDGTQPGKALDMVLFEGPVPFGLPPFPSQSDYTKAPWDPTYNQVLQIAKRQLGPYYKRPNGLPSDYDPGIYGVGPLSQNATNGPRTCIGYEPNTYTFVRDGNIQRANEEISFLRSLGYL